MKRILKLTHFLYPKLWITIGLGGFFFGFYLLITRILLSIDLQQLANEGVSGALHLTPTAFVWGFLFWVYMAILVQVVREVIKGIYLLLHR